MKKEKTIVIMIDAFRRDYINKTDTPFLFNLKKRFSCGKLNQPFGFKPAVGFYTGIHPSKLNQFVFYGYNKMKKIKYNFLEFIPKKINFHVLNLINHFTRKDMFFPRINMKYIKYFTTMQKKHFYQKGAVNAKTIFDIFLESRIRYLFYDFPLIVENGKSKLHYTLKNNDKNRKDKFLSLIKKDKDFYYIHLIDTDSCAHTYGPHAKEMKKTLKKTDRFIQEILLNFDLERDNILIWSDHGMVEVKKSVDLASKLPKFGEGYIYFLDSTMARFWFFNESKKKEVLSILKNQKDGKLLSKKDKKILKADFKNNFYGDEIFLMDSGVLLYPNFFNDSLVKGMHGYDLSDENEKTIFLTNKNSADNGNTEDLFPTLLKLMGLENQAKKLKIDGESLVSS